jgi:(R)-2-hydroxyacyl-CoA dehydratese activating ATPase
MISVGMDVGSRTVKLAVVCDGQLTLVRKRENGFDVLSVCRELLGELNYDVITVTGYGRHLLACQLNCGVISEIKAFALGAGEVFPTCRTILDIGGQDIKAIALDDSGLVCKFEMNDKCSAGTGRFLEIMAMALGCDLAGFSAVALQSTAPEKINSTCTVFAESEVVSMLARGASREGVALGIHQSVISRAMSMLSRVEITDDLVFLGGVALNPCALRLLTEAVRRPVKVPDDPQSIGALGCALYGLRSLA